MKCVAIIHNPNTEKEIKEVRRISNKDAEYLVKNGWHYVPKSVWKRERSK